MGISVLSMYYVDPTNLITKAFDEKNICMQVTQQISIYIYISVEAAVPVTHQANAHRAPSTHPPPLQHATRHPIFTA